MSNVEEMSDRARAYPSGDAQGQHPAPVGSGQGFLHQPGRVQCKKRVREVRLRYASWNVGTMTGRARELADVLKRRRINVACLQETKWKGTKAREIGEGYKFYYCGSDGKRNGVGIVLDKNLKESVIDVKRVNDRIIVVKIMYESLIINVISVYAPQIGCDDRVKEQFWTDFDAVMMNVPTNEQVFVGGDFNGHVGRMRGNYERVHGGWGFGCQNDEGEALLQAATAFDLAVVNTWFQKNTEHLITYKSGHHVTQIDYFLVRRSSLKNIKDCKVIPGEAVVSQHRPLIMDVILTSRPKAKERRPPKIKWHLLGKAELAREFRKVVVDKMIEMGEMNEKNVNECWSGMATCIRKAARSILGESKGNGVIERPYFP
ncbi:craniofacial development protein 2-like [Helicoverpa zea]|uniref:craniofacial development protein 2-like n=1 Tax=Helicoverpa zea TaxID=7113 RepID=UPI001F593C5A|nr:craniofacial development protein 2-like [Helicoverpa zea]